MLRRRHSGRKRGDEGGDDPTAVLAVLAPDEATQSAAKEARAHLDELAEDLDHVDCSSEPEAAPPPSDDLEAAYRGAARLIHPDFSSDDADRLRRTEVMAALNKAYEARDVEQIQAIMSDFELSAMPDSVAKRLVRAIRRQAAIGDRLEVISGEIATLSTLPEAHLQSEASAAEAQGRNLLNDMAEAMDSEIAHNETVIAEQRTLLNGRAERFEDEIAALDATRADLLLRREMLLRVMV